jgi:hypothetical protein
MKKHILKNTSYNKDTMFDIALEILNEEKFLALPELKQKLKDKYIFNFCNINKKCIQELRLINKKYYELIIDEMVLKITKNLKNNFWNDIYKYILDLEIDYCVSRKVVDNFYIGSNKDRYFIQVLDKKYMVAA